MKNLKKRILQTIFAAGLTFLQMGTVNAQTLPDVLNLKFNTSPSSTGKLKNYASNASKYSDSVTVLGLKTGGTAACGTGLLGNGASSAGNRVVTDVRLDLNKSWTIAFWMDGFKTQSLSYLFSNTYYSSFRFFTNGVSGAGNAYLRTNNFSLLIKGVADTLPHKVIIVHDAGAKVIKAYKDELFESAYTYADSMAIRTGVDTTFAVAGYTSSTTLENGSMMDEFMMYSYAIDTTKLSMIPIGTNPITYNVKGCGNSVTATTGKTFSKSGVYYDTLYGTGIECDTIITYNVNLYPTYMDTVSVSSCNSATYKGKTYTKSTVLYDTLNTIHGCDSIIMTEITVNYPSQDTQYFKGCGSYDFNGKTYLSSTTIMDTFTNVNGCDSIVITDITINLPAISPQSYTACGYYVGISGDTIRNSGTYFDTLTTVNGCDSVIISTITINPISVETQTYTACGFYVGISGDTIRTSGTYFDTLTTLHGCDSVIISKITINPISTSTQTISACGYYVTNTGDTLRNSLTYKDTFTNALGCDSIVTMDVTIIQVDNGVTRNGNELSSDQTNGSYIWLDCDNAYTPITGETQQTFTPTVNGNYAVEVTVQSCVDTSDCVAVTNLSFESLNANWIQVSPNPTEGIFVVTSKMHNIESLKISNANGQVVFTQDAQNQNEMTVNMKHLPSGIYFLEVEGGNNIDRLKIIKNN